MLRASCDNFQLTESKRNKKYISINNGMHTFVENSLRDGMLHKNENKNTNTKWNVKEYTKSYKWIHEIMPIELDTSGEGVYVYMFVDMHEIV